MFKIKVVILSILIIGMLYNINGNIAKAAAITSDNPNPVKGQKVIFTGTYSASDIPAYPGVANTKVCWVVNTQTQNVCVDAPATIPNFEYTFPDALLYDISLAARNKLDNSFIKALANISVNATETIDGGTGGNINGDGISLRFPNPLGGGTTTVVDLVINIINGIFGLLGAVAVIMIVYGGVIYMTGGSSKDGAEKGKKIITSAVIGLVIVLLSLAIIDLLFVLLGGR